MGGALKTGLQAAERKKEGPGSCAHSIFWPFFSKLQTAALRKNLNEGS